MNNFPLVRADNCSLKGILIGKPGMGKTTIMVVKAEKTVLKITSKNAGGQS